MVKLPTAHYRISKMLIGSVLAIAISGSALAQEESEGQTYAELLQQNADLALTVAHAEVTLQTQEEKIADLEAQLSRVEELTSSVNPLVAAMLASYEAEMMLDAPYNASERFARATRIRDMMENPNARDADMLKEALTMYEAEVNYGVEVDEYAGDNPNEEKAGWRLKACQENIQSEACGATTEMREAINERTGKSLDQLDLNNEEDAANVAALLQTFEREEKLRDGNFLRVGRLAFIYADIDGQDVQIYNIGAKRAAAAGGDPLLADNEWIAVEGTQQIKLFQAVKMAKGEAAVEVMQIPVLVNE
ncbi:MAG: DUF3450 family protein [Hellea sp.]|nr:DUF3450 family protein [Hellea sp.]